MSGTEGPVRGDGALLYPVGPCRSTLEAAGLRPRFHPARSGVSKIDQVSCTPPAVDSGWEMSHG